MVYFCSHHSVLQILKIILNFKLFRPYNQSSRVSLIRNWGIPENVKGKGSIVTTRGQSLQSQIWGIPFCCSANGFFSPFFYLASRVIAELSRRTLKFAHKFSVFKGKIFVSEYSAVSQGERLRPSSEVIVINQLFQKINLPQLL